MLTLMHTGHLICLHSQEHIAVCRVDAFLLKLRLVQGLQHQLN